MKITTRELTKIAVCTALLCVSAFISVPIPFTPIVLVLTLQTLMVNLIAFVLKPRQAFFSVTAYVLIGILGVPVFAGATGGFQRLFSATGGFIVAFIIAAPLICLFKGQGIVRHIIASVLIGMPVIYLIGTLHLSIIGGMDIMTALKAAVIPFILGDIIKCVIASVLGVYTEKALLKINM